jgi:hypothetical protein
MADDNRQQVQGCLASRQTLTGSNLRGSAAARQAEAK